MPAPYGDGLFAYEPPQGYGLNITDVFHIVEPKPGDPEIESAVDSKYPNVAIITFDKANQFGGMWAKEKLDLTMPFSTEMYLHLGREYNKTSNISDGMTFTLHNDDAGINAICGAWEGLGVYKGRKWVSPGTQTSPHGTYLRNSLVIEFDTYRNPAGSGSFVVDPSGGVAHCALLIPRDDVITATDHKYADFFTPSQQWVKFEAHWLPNGNGGGALRYTFHVNSDSKERVHMIDSVMNTFGDTKVYWGFTGSTGQQTSVQAAAITRLPMQGIIAEKTVKNAAGDDINHGKVLPGDILTYTIRVTAQSISERIGPIIIRDDISGNVEYAEGVVKVKTKAGEFDVLSSYAGSTMTVITAQFLDSESDWIEATFTVRVKADAAGETIYNKAEADGVGLSEPAETNTTDVTVFLAPTKNVSNNSEAGKNGSAVKLGDKITYEIHYANDGAAIDDIAISDVLNKGLDFVAANKGGLFDSLTRTIEWEFIDVPAGGTGIVSFVASVNDKAVVKVENNATVTTSEGEPQITNTVENQVIPEEPKKKVSDLSDTGKNGGSVKVGNRITYEISYLNHTATDVTVVVTDSLTTGVDFESALNGGSYDEKTHTVTWNLQNIASGTGGTVSFTVRVNEKAVSEIENYATVKVGDNDPGVTNRVINPLKGSHCINIYKSTKCRKTIKGRKLWVDDNNKGNTRPLSVEIILRRDGEVYKSVRVDAMGDGVFIFGCLPIRKDFGHIYDYQVDEVIVPNKYIKSIDGYNITNTLYI